MSRVSRLHRGFHPMCSQVFELPKGFPWTQKLSTLEGALVWLAAPPPPPFLYFYFTFSIVVLKITGSLKN